MTSQHVATITPLNDTHECETDGCEDRELTARIEPDHLDEQRVLCPVHRVAYLREVSER